MEFRSSAQQRRIVSHHGVKPGQEKPLRAAIDSGTLGRGSVAGDEFLNDMAKARVEADGVCTWVEVCFCPTPPQEERPYWDQYFDLLRIQDAHARKNCRDPNGTEPWACCDCDCTRRLEQRLAFLGEPILATLKAEVQTTPNESHGKPAHSKV